MRNSIECAFPILETETGINFHPGLTKREYFAGLAMQSMIQVCQNWDNQPDNTLHTTSAMASIMYADALLKELEK